MPRSHSIATSSAMGKAEQLAGGIGVALITTAGGLTVAIPALMLYMYFAGRLDALVMEMDSVAQKVVDLISAEGLSAQTAGHCKTYAEHCRKLAAEARAMAAAHAEMAKGAGR